MSTIDPSTIEPTSPVFAARLASVLRTSRRDSGTKLRSLARTSGGTFTVRQLRQLESGDLDLGGVDLYELARLYDVDLSVILLHRIPLVANPEFGKIQTAGITRSFAPGQTEALLIAYLKLVRELRDLQYEPTIVLRRSDIEALATSLGSDGPTVLEHLGELMHLTAMQRRSMVAAFVAGATIIALAGGALAVDTSTYVPDSTGDADTTAISESDEGDDEALGVGADLEGAILVGLDIEDDDGPDGDGASAGRSADRTEDVDGPPNPSSWDDGSEGGDEDGDANRGTDDEGGSDDGSDDGNEDGGANDGGTDPEPDADDGGDGGSSDDTNGGSTDLEPDGGDGSNGNSDGSGDTNGGSSDGGSTDPDPDGGDGGDGGISDVDSDDGDGSDDGGSTDPDDDPNDDGSDDSDPDDDGGSDNDGSTDPDPHDDDSSSGDDGGSGGGSSGNDDGDSNGGSTDPDPDGGDGGRSGHGDNSDNGDSSDDGESDPGGNRDDGDPADTNPDGNSSDTDPGTADPGDDSGDGNGDNSNDSGVGNDSDEGIDRSDVGAEGKTNNGVGGGVGGGKEGNRGR